MKTDGSASLSAVLLAPHRFFAFLCFIHSSAQKSIHQTFIELTLSAKSSDGDSRGCKNEDILDAF